LEVDRDPARARGDYVDGVRPCPFTSCCHHFADLWGPEGAHDADACALDVADRGAHEPGELARILEVAGAALASIEAAAQRWLNEACARAATAGAAVPRRRP